MVPPIALGVLMFLIGGWGLLVWGYCISTVILWHSSFTINSLSHIFGRQRYQTTDTSKNNAVLALVTMGEGWHNNHHHYMASARQGFFWWEIDMTLLRAVRALLVPHRVGLARASHPHPARRGSQLLNFSFSIFFFLTSGGDTVAPPAPIPKLKTISPGFSGIHCPSCAGLLCECPLTLRVSGVGV